MLYEKINLVYNKSVNQKERINVNGNYKIL